MTTVLDVRNLTVSFPGRHGDPPTRVVDGVSLSLARGEAVGLVGESGSGKSMTALALIGLVPEPGRADSDVIELGGRDISRLSEAELERVRGRQIAMVFQDPMSSLNPVLTIGRQLAEPLRHHLGMNAAAARRRAAELLDMVGIPEPAGRLASYPHEFSGGMRQRVMIAMALACDPLVLVADEPTTALDVTVQAEIVDLLQRLRTQLGMAVLWITHDLGLLARFADRVAVMYAGRVFEEAPVDDIYTDPRNPYTIGLLRSVPTLTADRDQALWTIEGTPPDPARIGSGCPFRPRCRYAIDKCAQAPDLAPVGPGHRSYCWVAPHGRDATTDIAANPGSAA